MKKITVFIIVAVVTISTSFQVYAQHIQDTLSYFRSPSRLGLLVTTIPIHYYKNTTGIGIVGQS